MNNNKHIDLLSISLINWGPFHGIHPNIDMSSLKVGINGKNGSGKTSFIDAILSTFITEKKIALGGASSSGKSSSNERSIKAYVNGALPGTLNNEVEYLRGPGDIGLCLINALNNESNLSFAFGIFVQINSVRDISKSFFLYNGELDILNRTLFALGNGVRSQEVKQNLKNHGVVFYEQFKHYKKDLYPKLNLSEKKIDLLLKTVSMKEIRDIDSFVKETIISRFHYEDLISDLIINTENLVSVDSKIQIAQKKLDLLSHPNIDYPRYQEVTGKIDKLIEIKNNLEYFKQKKSLPILELRVEKLEKEVSILKTTISDNEVKISELEQKQDELSNSIASSDKSRDIFDKEKDLKEYNRKLIQVEEVRKSFVTALKNLKIGLQINSNEDFYLAWQNIERKQSFNISEIPKLRDEKAKVENLILAKRKLISELKAQILKIDNNSFLVDSKFIDVKEKVESALSIKCTFIFEYIEVEEGEWDLALEKRLRPFQDIFIIQKEHESKVMTYLSENKLSARFLIQSESGLLTSLSFKGDENLNLRDDTPAVVCDFLNNIFTHKELSRSLKSFHANSLNIDMGHREGLLASVDHSISRIDYDAFYLTNLEKTRDKIRRKLELSESELGQSEKLLSSLAENLETIESEMTLMNKIDYIKKFNQIDTSSFYAKIDQLTSEISNLKDNEEFLEELKQQQEMVRSESKALSESKGSMKTKCESYTKEIQENNLIIKKIVDLLRHFNDESFISIEENIYTVLNRPKRQVEFDNIIELEAYFKDLKEEHDSVLEIQRNIKGRIERHSSECILKIQNLDSSEKERFSENMPDDEKIENLHELKEELVAKEIPKLQRSFRAYIEEDLANGLSQLSHSIDQGVEACFEQEREFNDFVRSSLSLSNHDIIELKIDKIEAEETRRFDKSLKNLIPDFMDDSYDEIYAKKLSSFIQDLKEEKYVKRCVDPTARVKFSVIKSGRDYSSSKAFSGGERIELCYFILAASYNRIFELNSDTPTFRPMIVDEVSMKLDSQNIKKSFQIFTSLDVQLFAIEPEANFEILSESVDKIITIQKKGDNKTSLISLINREEVG